MAVRTFIDSAGTQWTVWAVRPEGRERRRGADRRAGRDRRTPLGSRVLRYVLGEMERRMTPDRRLSSDRRLTPGARVAILPGLEQGWLCFEGGGARRRLVPIPGDWETADAAALAGYHARAVPTRQHREGR